MVATLTAVLSICFSLVERRGTFLKLSHAWRSDRRRGAPGRGRQRMVPHVGQVQRRGPKPAAHDAGPHVVRFGTCSPPTTLRPNAFDGQAVPRTSMARLYQVVTVPPVPPKHYYNSTINSTSTLEYACLACVLLQIEAALPVTLAMQPRHTPTRRVDGLTIRDLV